MGDAPRSLFSGLQNLKGQRKPAVKVNADEDSEQRELITGLEGSRIKSAAPIDEQPAGKKVVPKLENTFTIGRKFAPSYIPSSGADAVVGDGEDRFELAEQPQQDPQQEVQYGLQKRSAEADAARKDSRAAARDLRVLELEKFKKDMEELPDTTHEQYEKVGVEEFGMALLRGMGWNEGEGVGRNKQKVDAKEYIRRPDRLGLGAKPVLVKEEKKGPVKMGDKPKPNPKDMVLPVGEDGRVRHMKTLDEKLVSRAEVEPGPFPGKVMRIVDGRHTGLLCKVLELLPKEEGRSDRARVRLHPSEQDVTVRCKELGERSEETGQRGGSGAADRERGRDAGSSGREGRGQEQQREHKRKRSSSPSGSRAAAAPPRSSSQPIWLHPSIRVRIVDKHVRKGKLYLKKAVVLDVHPGGTCDVSVEETQEVLQLHQDALETVVPKQAGAAVLVVSGRLKGQKAELLQVNSEKQAAAIKLVADYSVQRLHLDDISQYMGQLEEDY